MHAVEEVGAGGVAGEGGLALRLDGPGERVAVAGEVGGALLRGLHGLGEFGARVAGPAGGVPPREADHDPDQQHAHAQPHPGGHTGAAGVPGIAVARGGFVAGVDVIEQQRGQQRVLPRASAVHRCTGIARATATALPT